MNGAVKSHVRAIAVAVCVLGVGLVASGCGPFGEDEKAADAGPKLLRLEDLKKYPDGSPEAALLKHIFYIQWGSAQNLIAGLHPKIPAAVGTSDIIGAYSFLRPSISDAQLRIVGKQKSSEGTLLFFEIVPRKGPAQPDSMLLRKRGKNYVIVYDGLLDRGIPASILAASQGQPTTAKGNERRQLRIDKVLRRYRAVAGSQTAAVLRRRRRAAAQSAGGASEGAARGGVSAESPSSATQQP